MNSEEDRCTQAEGSMPRNSQNQSDGFKVICILPAC